MSFQSPLLPSSLRRPGAEEGASHSPAPSDEEFLRRRRTPGTTERPLGSGTPLFSSNNATAPLRPSPLGLLSQSHLEGGAGTPTTTVFTPSGSSRFLGGGGATTPSSTGTNFKARLLAMQTAAGSTAAGGGAGTPTATTPSTGLARPGQLGWASSTQPLSSRRVSSSTSTFLVKQQQRQQQQHTGPPPPVSSLEDELVNLKIDLKTSTTAGDTTTTAHLDTSATTPAKGTGILRPARTTTAAAATTPATPTAPLSATTTKAAATLAPFSFNTTPTALTPPVTSTKGTWTKGKKAMGVGALSIARSPLASTNKSVGNGVVNENNILEGSIAVPTTSIDDDVADKHIYGIKQLEQEEVKEEDGKQGDVLEDEKKKQQLVNDARSLQYKLRSQLPEFGISQWSPPTTSTAKLAAATFLRTMRNSDATAAAVEKTEALKELANLRSQADVKLDGAFISRIIGIEDTPQQQQQQKKNEEERKNDDDSDVLCQGVRSAFRATLPELNIPSATPEAAALPPSTLGSILASTKSTSKSGAGGGSGSGSALSPLERGTRRGGKEQQGHSQVADEIEERLERLKLLRDQAIQVVHE
jgi:hypothetical protein